jgi:hypothetical protein
MHNIIEHMIFEKGSQTMVPTETTNFVKGMETMIVLKMAVFWVVTSCSLVEVYPDDGRSKHL